MVVLCNVIKLPSRLVSSVHALELGGCQPGPAVWHRLRKESPFQSPGVRCRTTLFRKHAAGGCGGGIDGRGGGWRGGNEEVVVGVEMLCGQKEKVSPCAIALSRDRYLEGTQTSASTMLDLGF